LRALELHDAACLTLHGTAVERSPAWSVTVLPAMKEGAA
jgi:hypothetical protein